MAEATGRTERRHLLSPEADLPETEHSGQADVVRVVLSIAELG